MRGIVVLLGIFLVRACKDANSAEQVLYPWLSIDKAILRRRIKIDNAIAGQFIVCLYYY